ncbi:RHS repeat-associated core domain-containing protein, partial [Streptomyces sp. NPDC008343]|uniref:RHS repeat-associated core domain-containing protein n=1 Tax=Streptomyces sp. NPDC008343 TaxID=3364828 RepID=UPI0036E474BE
VTVGGKKTGLEYDSAGNLTKDADGNTYTYDESNQLTASTVGGKTTKYTYWANGLRATKTGPDGTTLTYHYAGDGQLVNETDQDGNHAGYLLGAAREARTHTGPQAATDYYTHNYRGDVTALTGSQGQDTTRYTYTDYGRTHTTGTNPTGIAHNPYGYTGAYTDTETGLLYLKTRYYNPTLTAFHTLDSAEAGMLNLYTYATADPINHTDPTGRLPEWVNGMNFTALFGLGAAVVGLATTIYAFPELALGWRMVSVAAQALLDGTVVGTSGALAADQFGLLDLSEGQREALGLVGGMAGVASAMLGVAAYEEAKTLVRLRQEAEAAAAAKAEKVKSLYNAHPDSPSIYSDAVNEAIGRGSGTDPADLGGAVVKRQVAANTSWRTAIDDVVMEGPLPDASRIHTEELSDVASSQVQQKVLGAVDNSKRAPGPSDRSPWLDAIVWNGKSWVHAGGARPAAQAGSVWTGKLDTTRGYTKLIVAILDRGVR